MLLTYSLTKAKRTFWDVAQFVADLLGCASRDHKILTTVMTCIVVDKSTDYAKPHSICFLPPYQNKSLSWQLRHCLHRRSFICNRIGFDAVTPFVCTAPAHCLHGRSFICNHIGFDAVTPFVYTAPVRYQNRVVLKTLSKVERFQNDTVPLVVYTVKPHRFKNGLAWNWLAREVSCSMRFPGH